MSKDKVIEGIFQKSFSLILTKQFLNGTVIVQNNTFTYNLY